MRIMGDIRKSPAAFLTRTHPFGGTRSEGRLRRGSGVPGTLEPSAPDRRLPVINITPSVGRLAPSPSMSLSAGEHILMEGKKPPAEANTRRAVRVAVMRIF
ncbi:hypothetical protein E2C01_056455 [Portunus trituberculatus]|uniref:Uncharacterized protein n=1 Tax=Portunus trituberculatus TaxID=210409 RepID=A0A5B7GQN6_PORTR|nr:hypothetical protein [Portunus trituberculatus]